MPVEQEAPKPNCIAVDSNQQIFVSHADENNLTGHVLRFAANGSQRAVFTNPDFNPDFNAPKVRISPRREETQTWITSWQHRGRTHDSDDISTTHTHTLTTPLSPTNPHPEGTRAEHGWEKESTAKE